MSKWPARKAAGVVGAMKSELRKWPVGTVAETYVRMLTMRVIEKDFILYGDIGVMGGHRKAYREFEFGMMGSGLDPATQETLTRLAGDYRADLLVLVENQVKLGEQIQAFNRVLSAMPDRFAHLFEAASAAMERARSEKAKVRDAIGRAGITMGAIILVLARLTSLILVRSITRLCGPSRRRCEGWRRATEPVRCRARNAATKSAPWRAPSKFPAQCRGNGESEGPGRDQRAPA